MGIQLNKIQTRNTSMENCVFITEQNINKYPTGTLLLRYYVANGKRYINKVLKVVGEPKKQKGKVPGKKEYQYKIDVRTIMEAMHPVCIDSYLKDTGKWSGVVYGNTLLTSKSTNLNAKVWNACNKIISMIAHNA